MPAPKRLPIIGPNSRWSAIVARVVNRDYEGNMRAAAREMGVDYYHLRRVTRGEADPNWRLILAIPTKDYSSRKVTHG
jgi:hypothetical protein